MLNGKANTWVDIDGVSVNVSTEVETIEQLREWIGELNAIRNETQDDGAPPGEPGDVKPPPVKIDGPWGVMDVTEASGKPGEIVAVELLGVTDVPINGWMAAIGYESDKLDVVKVEFGNYLRQDGRKTTEFWRARQRGHPRIGNAGPHLQLAHTSWVLSVPIDKPIDELTGEDGVVGIAPALLLPPETVLATITFKIKEDAVPGIVPLLNWSGKFGKVPVRHVYTRLRESGLDPVTDDGSVTILSA